MASKTVDTRNAEVYEALCQEFDSTYTLTKGGRDLEYLSGEQVVERLNVVLGLDGWEFRTVAWGLDAENIWVQGQMTAFFPERAVVREQFGECQVQRGMATGDARKGAATDALKKCASLLGVGLYLSHRDAQGSVSSSGNGQGVAESSGPLKCEECGDPLQETRFKDGTVWNPAQLAGFGRRKHGHVYCMAHYRDANDKRRRQEVTDGDVSA